MVDVIDINYRSKDQQNYHHTTMDTMDKLSERSFEIVGRTILLTVGRLGQ